MSFAHVLQGADGAVFVAFRGLMVGDAVVGFWGGGFEEVHDAGESLDGGVVVLLSALTFRDSEEGLWFFL